MPHKADRSFFDSKREWSKRKDLILSNYLKPYLAKVAKLQRPILVVDGFAGAGTYSDGEAGSPVIIATKVEEALSRQQLPMSVICIEEDEELHRRLQQSVSSYPFVSTRQGSFLDHLAEIEKLSASFTSFLYIDPYAIEGLEWEAMSRVFEGVRLNRSVEVLLNFSALSFVRRGLALVSPLSLAGLPADEDDAAAEPPSIVRLNSAVGGDWWQKIVRDPSTSFINKVQAVTAGYCDQLRKHFKEVVDHAIKAKWTDSVPKYSLVFGSRSTDALILMNDAAIKSRDVLADQSRSSGPTLFETRPEELVPDDSRLPGLVLSASTARMTRKELTALVIRRDFCTFTESRIHASIRGLIERGKLHSSTGKSRINDSVEVWKA